MTRDQEELWSCAKPSGDIPIGKRRTSDAVSPQMELRLKPRPRLILPRNRGWYKHSDKNNGKKERGISNKWLRAPIYVFLYINICFMIAYFLLKLRILCLHSPMLSNNYQTFKIVPVFQSQELNTLYFLQWSTHLTGVSSLQEDPLGLLNRYD